MAALVFDAGPLIGLERQDPRAEAWLQVALEDGIAPRVPAVVLAEVWRGGRRSANLARALRACRVEATDEPVARLAGELLARLGGNATIDALVVATAALLRADLLSADPDDVGPLAAALGVRLLVV